MALDPATLQQGDFIRDNNQRIWRVVKFIPEPTVHLQQVGSTREEIAGATDVRFANFVKLVPETP